MLGIYEWFPCDVHRKVCFATSASNRKLQHVLLQALYEMNKATFNLEDIINPSTPLCTVIFEFGIAETNHFNYLDNEGFAYLREYLRKRTMRVMDFLCAIRYYKLEGKKKTPLKFDYYLIRFRIDKRPIEMQVFHERGPRHMTPQDIVNIAVSRINKMHPEEMIKAVEASQFL